MGGSFCNFTKSLTFHHLTFRHYWTMKLLPFISKTCILAYIECRTLKFWQRNSSSFQSIQVLHNLLSSFMSTYWSGPWLWPILNCGRCKYRAANCNCGTGQKQPSSVHIQCNGTGRCHKWASTNFIYLSFQFFFSINIPKYFLDWRKWNASPEFY